jgi:hypothetical protein
MILLNGQSINDSISANDILLVDLSSGSALYRRYISSVLVESATLTSGIITRGPYKEDSTFQLDCTAGSIIASAVSFIGPYNIQYHRSDFNTGSVGINQFTWNTDAAHGWNVGYL